MKLRLNIASKLILYFAFFLLLFSLSVGSTYSLLLSRETVALHKQDLEDKSINIANTLSEFIAGQRLGKGGQGQGGYGAYMHFLDDIAMTDIWVMDTDSQIIRFGHDNQTIYSKDLPSDAEAVIAKAMSGEISFGEGFSELLGTKSITVAAPILLSDHQVAGIVLLHEPVTGIGTAVSHGLRLMVISMLFALLLASISAVLLALHFTKPLRRMNETANRFAQGDYRAQTKITQQDEIGELASSLDMLAEKLESAAQESERLTKLRQDFVANISHELRTPVTVLRGSLEALCDGIVTEAEMVEEYHRQMLNDCIFLERLVNDLLELSRLQNTSFIIEKNTINLCEVMRDAARSMERIATQKHVPLLVESELSICAVQGDYGRIRQMILILLDNAIKFSRDGETVSMHLTDSKQKRIVSITNRGIMIPKEDIPHIFERFYKLRDETNKTGTGLGLPIAKQISIRHGFLLKAMSDPDKTVFSIEIPIEE